MKNIGNQRKNDKLEKTTNFNHKNAKTLNYPTIPYYKIPRPGSGAMTNWPSFVSIRTDVCLKQTTWHGKKYVKNCRNYTDLFRSLVCVAFRVPKGGKYMCPLSEFIGDVEWEGVRKGKKLPTLLIKKKGLERIIP